MPGRPHDLDPRVLAIILVLYPRLGSTRIAEVLNRLHIDPGPLGDRWHASRVLRILKREGRVLWPR